MLYATNNASRPPEEVAAHLRELGLPCMPDAVATSSQAGAWLLCDRPASGGAVLAVGGRGGAASPRRGCARSPPDDAATAGPLVAVLQGYGPRARDGPRRGGLRRPGWCPVGWRPTPTRPCRPIGASPGQRARSSVRSRMPWAAPRTSSPASPARPCTPCAPSAWASSPRGARRRRPARHGHRGSGRRGHRLAARADRGRRPPGLPRGPGAPPADVGRARPLRAPAPLSTPTADGGVLADLTAAVAAVHAATDAGAEPGRVARLVEAAQSVLARVAHR